MFEEALDLADYLEWPNLRTIDVAKVWAWAIEQEGFLEGFGGGTTGRALDAFAHLFASPRADEATMLLWSLVGIEAIYVRGRQGLLEQVRDKGQIHLGKQEAYRKKISRMYDFRSRFVHGDLMVVDNVGACCAFDMEVA
jgi:Apea-like HEPN